MQAWPRLDRVDWLLVGAVVFIVTVLMLRTRSSTDSTPNLDIGDLMSQLHQELNSHAEVAAKAQESPLFLVKSADLEVTFVIKRDEGNKASFKVEPVTLDMSSTTAAEATHKITLHVEALAPTTLSLPPRSASAVGEDAEAAPEHNRSSKPPTH
jgi:hypothetical protein